jgi:hypothetical protein
MLQSVFPYKKHSCRLPEDNPGNGIRHIGNCEQVIENNAGGLLIKLFILLFFSPKAGWEVKKLLRPYQV